jgi:hypothetical protein
MVEYKVIAITELPVSQLLFGPTTASSLIYTITQFHSEYYLHFCIAILTLREDKVAWMMGWPNYHLHWSL